MFITSGICARISKEPGPLPCVPGSGSEFTPRQPQPEPPSIISATTTSDAVRLIRSRISHLRSGS